MRRSVWKLAIRRVGVLAVRRWRLGGTDAEEKEKICDIFTGNVSPLPDTRIKLWYLLLPSKSGLKMTLSEGVAQTKLFVTFPNSVWIPRTVDIAAGGISWPPLHNVALVWHLCPLCAGRTHFDTHSCVHQSTTFFSFFCHSGHYI